MTRLFALPARVKLWLASLVAALGAALGIYAKGRSDAAARAKLHNLKADQQAHERINDADTGADATDDERIERLRDFAKRHGNRG